MKAEPHLDWQVAFLTGQSDPRSSALTPVQTGFLAALPIPPESRVWQNFPYPAGAPASAAAPVPLLRASWANLRQFLASPRPSFAARHRPAVLALLAQAKRTLFLAGSCGLELFNNLHLPPTALAGVTVLAYGPVARRVPDCPHLLVQGAGDWLSRYYFPQVKLRVRGGHLGYLSNPEVLALAREAVDRIATRAL